MTLPNVVNHARVRAAADFVSGRFGDPERDDFRKKEFKEFRTVVLKAGVSIRQIGLPQFTAFSLSKEKGYRDEVDALFSWLTVAVTTETLCKPLKRENDEETEAIVWAPNRPAEFMQELLERNSSEMAALEAEAQEYLSWLKRITEGVKKVRDRWEKNDPQEPSPHTEVKNAELAKDGK